jgi:hypothetical protein
MSNILETLVDEKYIVNIIKDYVNEMERGDLYNQREELLDEHCDEWESVIIHENLSEDFIIEFIGEMDLELVCSMQNLSMKFIRKHLDILHEHIDYIICHQKIDSQFIKDYGNSGLINFDILCQSHLLDEDIIEMFFSEFNTNLLAIKQNLSNYIIFENRDIWDWKLICKHQILNEEIMSMCKEYLHWANVCKYQHFTEMFVINNVNDELLYWIINTGYHRHFSEDFCNELQNYCNNKLKKSLKDEMDIDYF